MSGRPPTTLPDGLRRVADAARAYAAAADALDDAQAAADERPGAVMGAERARLYDAEDAARDARDRALEYLGDAARREYGREDAGAAS